MVVVLGVSPGMTTYPRRGRLCMCRGSGWTWRHAIRCDATTDSGDGIMFYDTWPRNKWGVPEPLATATEAAGPGDTDLLIVSGLSFDTHGHRLGQGKG